MRQPASEGAHQLFADRGVIAGTVDLAGHDDDDRSPTGDPLLGDEMCPVLGLVVPAQEARTGIAPVRLVDDVAVGIPEDIDRRHVQGPSNRDGFGCGKDASRGADGGIADRRTLTGGHPDPIHARSVDDGVGPGHRAAQLASTTGRCGRSRQPRSRRARARSGSRTAAMTSSPRARSFLTTAEPMNPAPPVTKTRMGRRAALLASLVASLSTAPSPARPPRARPSRCSGMRHHRPRRWPDGRCPGPCSSPAGSRSSHRPATRRRPPAW